MTRESTVPTPPALIAACGLAAAHEAARRIRNGDTIDDPNRYVRIRTEKLTRSHAALWASIPDPDPIDFARSLEPDLAPPPTHTPTTTRTLPDGTTQRFIPGTGWATIRMHIGHLPTTDLADQLAAAAVHTMRTQLAQLANPDPDEDPTR